MSHTETYTVHGMTCGHCVSAVSTELGQLDGVTRVVVDLPTGAVDVTSDGQLSIDMLRDAVEAAGFELAQ